jgi:hypothetical protein
MTPPPLRAEEAREWLLSTAFQKSGNVWLRELRGAGYPACKPAVLPAYLR